MAASRARPIDRRLHLFFFGDRRADLLRWRGEVTDWLWEERGLRLKHPKARILSCHGHLDALGYRIRREGLEALPRATHRFQIETSPRHPSNHPHGSHGGRWWRRQDLPVQRKDRF